MANSRHGGGYSTAAKVATFLAILLAVILTFVGVSFGTGWWQLRESEETSTDEVEQTSDIGGMLIEDEEINNGVMTLSMAKLSADEYDEYGVSTLAETAYKLTVVPDPSDATDTYSWSCTNTSQISLSPSSDTKSCTVSCSGAFGTQATITVTSNTNSDVYAEATIDYVKRLSSVTYSITDGSVAFSNSTSNVATATITATPVWGTGTITPEFEITGGTLENNVSADSSISNTVQSGNEYTTYTRSVAQTKNVTFTGNSISVTTPFDSFVASTTTSSSTVSQLSYSAVDTYANISLGYPTETQLASTYNNSFFERATGTTSDGTLTINYTISYNPSGSYLGGYSTTGSSEIGVAFDVSALTVNAVNVALDNEGIVF